MHGLAGGLGERLALDADADEADDGEGTTGDGAETDAAAGSGDDGETTDDPA